jgi:hypothetical protein
MLLRDLFPYNAESYIADSQRRAVIGIAGGYPQEDAALIPTASANNRQAGGKTVKCVHELHSASIDDALSDTRDGPTQFPGSTARQAGSAKTSTPAAGWTGLELKSKILQLLLQLFHLPSQSVNLFLLRPAGREHGWIAPGLWSARSSTPGAQPNLATVSSTASAAKARSARNWHTRIPQVCCNDAVSTCDTRLWSGRVYGWTDAVI